MTSPWRVLAALLLAAAPAFGATTTPPASKPAATTPPGHVGKIPLADRFKSASAAAAHCPGDVVVWSTLSKSGTYHLSGSRYYGKTKHGAYVCEKDAKAAGFHQSKV
jgi:hypothetical protein